MRGPAWYVEHDGSCQSWIDPPGAPGTRALGPGHWRDEEGEHYLAPDPDLPVCEEAAAPWMSLGQICIEDEQRELHVTSEAIAVVFVVPFMFYLALQKELPAWARAVSFGLGVGTLAVDGTLLLKYLRAKSDG
jgi:hypothetical protein